MPARLQLKKVSVSTPTGRPLFHELDVTLDDEHVALVGRNGVGKSTLLELLAGLEQPTSGAVLARSKPCFVPQLAAGATSLSSGEQRRSALEAARTSGAEILLLDEPSEHLDEDAVAWLRGWLQGFPGCALVATHDRRLLADFQHFFVISEGGCHYFGGSLAELEAHLEREHEANERRYVSNLHRLAESEEHTLHVARRKARKKRYGRCRELDRANPRILLNKKREQAQVSHARLAKLREARLAALQDWTRSSRRALDVSLAVELTPPQLPPDTGEHVVTLRGVAASASGRALFEGLDLSLGRERLALVGPNGAGKTTLLRIMLGERRPDLGRARCEPARIGSIEQGGKNWLLDASLHACLSDLGLDQAAAAQLLASHKFPLALSERPLRSLSPGERARAALICLFARRPAPELLILDEPTYSLDLVGLRALTDALKRWPGGLVVASHDRAFLGELGVTRTIELGRRAAGAGARSAPARSPDPAHTHGAG